MADGHMADDYAVSRSQLNILGQSIRSSIEPTIIEPIWPWPRPAMVTVHHKRREFERMDADGNTPVFRDSYEVEQVPAKVWPVTVDGGRILVEWEDGTLGAVGISDVRLV